MRSSLLPSIGLFLLLGATSCVNGEVVRVFDGVEVPGRFINDWAYASYARGIEWEARGELEVALRFYGEALNHDPRSAELWTRVGALRCRLGQGGDKAFAEAQEHRPNYEPTWRARAECAETRGNDAAALTHARRAVALDPSRDETVLLLSRLLVKADKHADAERWLRSLAVRSPSSTLVWQAVATFARGRAPALLALAEARLARLQPSIDAPPPSATPVSPKPWQHVDEALVQGDLALARTRVRKAHLDIRMLAARAILVGRPKLALEEAALRLGADPNDGDVRVALALAADLTGETKRAGEVLAALPPASGRLTATGAALLAELLVRHESIEAASLWLGVSVSSMTGAGAPRARLGRAFEVAPKKGEDDE